MKNEAWPYMTWKQRFACWRWDVKYFFRCHHVWFTKKTISQGYSEFHICVRNRWHKGACRDRLGLNHVKKDHRW